jgi:hypothetical protein
LTKQVTQVTVERVPAAWRAVGSIPPDEERRMTVDSTVHVPHGRLGDPATRRPGDPATRR